jgi:DNA-binding NarL/FixJ family response regulator
MTIRVLLAEDHAIVRRGLEQLLATVEDMTVVGSAADGEEAVVLAAERAPDVVVMDLEMPRMGGIEATRRIAASGNPACVVVLTSFSDRERILDALDAGAVGYLLKDAEPSVLVEGIRAAAGGDSPLHPRAASAVLQARSEGRPAAGLSDRQRDVLVLIAEGKPNKQIARALGISEKTVKGHVTAILQLLGVTDRTQAALWAARNRIA